MKLQLNWSNKINTAFTFPHLWRGLRITIYTKKRLIHITVPPFKPDTCASCLARKNELYRFKRQNKLFQPW